MIVQPTKPVRFAMVGCGRIARSHLEALQTMEDAAVGAVVETRLAAGQAFAEENKCPYFDDYRDPRIAEATDVVLLCTPPNTHHEIAKHFLENGLHVLCEKPLTLTSEEAADLVATARARGLVLMMASKFRYVDDVIKAKAIIESGLLGTPVLFENVFCAKVAMHGRWNAEPAISGGGVLIDNGTHSIDVARYLLGPVANVQAHIGVGTEGLPVDETVRLHFRSASGVLGTVDLSWSITKETDAYVSVYGSAGTLHVGWKGSRYRQEGSKEWVPFGAGYGKLAALKGQLSNFVGCVRRTAMPLISPDDALASVRAIEAAYASARSGAWAPVESVS